MNMVLDLHKTAGYSFDNAENESGFFEDAALQERFCRLWERLARHFGQYHNRIAFELLNEVTDSSYSKAWNKVAGECIRRIRCIAPDVYILVGGYNYNCIEAIADLEIPCDDKIVYNFHCYEPIIFTHQSASWVEGMPSDFRIAYPASVSTYADAYRQFPLKLVDLVTNAPVATVGTEFFDALFAKAVRIAEERNTTLYCGEYGVIETADRESTVRWYEAIHTAFRKYGIGRAAWSYKEMDFGLVDHGMIEALKMYL
jgi:aryl-phospho-beta-D-glucosidase BglC (GH1 family)